MTDERMEMLLKESFVNIRPGAELQEKLLQRLYAQEQVLTGRQQGNRYNLRRRVLTTACGSVTGHRLCGHGNRKTLSCDGNHNRICEL